MFSSFCDFTLLLYMLNETVQVSIMPETDKLRVLCLHGYRQNADGFKSKLGSFRKQLNKYVEFVFLSAPHEVPPSQDDENRSEQRSWWFNHDNGTFKGTNKNGPAFGFAESIAMIEKTWTDEGPFNGLLGFSQGACLVGLLCSLGERGRNLSPTNRGSFYYNLFFDFTYRIYCEATICNTGCRFQIG